MAADAVARVRAVVSRPRTIWLAVAVALVTVAGLVVYGRRRRTPTSAVPLRDWPTPVAAPATTLPPPVTQDEVDTEPPLPADSDWPMHREFGDLAQDDRDRPLATWIRVAIVVSALIAFFAVSLLAKKV